MSGAVARAEEAAIAIRDERLANREILRGATE